mgnify:CR=1 FL=1
MIDMPNNTTLTAETIATAQIKALRAEAVRLDPTHKG